MSKLKFIKYFIGFLACVFIVVQGYFFVYPNRTICKFPAVPVLSISTITYGSFVESIPQKGIIIFNNGELKVRVEIDEMYLSRISKGLTASSAINNKKYQLVINQVDPTIVRGRFNVDMNFEEQISDSLIGKSVRLKIKLSEPTNAALLPVGGFYKDTYGKWIFVVKGTTAVKKEIKLGRKNLDYFEVIEGLNPGDRVITSSYELFNEEESIDIAEIEQRMERADDLAWLPWF